ncbi:helix-turn-helix transcriptional regulator [Pandoraea commovens]|uniref:helix-turn-helix transcriptional regulator n=1 Tax=Pandoraea commovens TaxID=2508289 RepID=UPI001C2DA650|nr:AlpA family transcriptional regulator [Pandoraea commovens]
MNNQISIREDLAKVALLRRPDVERITGLSRSSIYAMMKIGEFPRSIPLTGRIVAWLESEILGWVQSRIDIREANSTSTRPQHDPKRIPDTSSPDRCDGQPSNNHTEISLVTSTRRFENPVLEEATSSAVITHASLEPSNYPTDPANITVTEPVNSQMVLAT